MAVTASPRLARAAAACEAAMDVSCNGRRMRSRQQPRSSKLFALCLTTGVLASVSFAGIPKAGRRASFPLRGGDGVGGRIESATTEFAPKVWTAAMLPPPVFKTESHHRRPTLASSISVQQLRQAVLPVRGRYIVALSAFASAAQGPEEPAWSPPSSTGGSWEEDAEDNDEPETPFFVGVDEIGQSDATEASKKPHAESDRTTREVYITGIEFSTREAEIRPLLQQHFGRLKSLRFKWRRKKNPPGGRKHEGYGIAIFASHASARKAIAASGALKFKGFFIRMYGNKPSKDILKHKVEKKREPWIYEQPSTHRGTTKRGKKGHFHLLDRYIRRIDALVPEDMEDLVRPLSYNPNLEQTTKSLKVTFDDAVSSEEFSEDDIYDFFAPDVPVSVAIFLPNTNGTVRQDQAEAYAHFADNEACRSARRHDGERLAGFVATVRYTVDAKWDRVLEKLGRGQNVGMAAVAVATTPAE
mmetsp:Transcript_41931/g.115643  ORF Transcript_41931/g.115643 Transcript_41931/m.115643 type:complete len:472 (-) Transcript_41931:169-1584(-)|eukprot:CAMPEP_0117531554 /NCGR_PEP_ID=MMETSP0784-20121206/38918_1 /TAXON_ID=39447 /ORGANISM="" /LENGTH=471 /DNA_ID=CAMNT_0005327931 /DNA_START=28 /DNA_END=1443 /DNA_ORIENTATION=+